MNTHAKTASTCSGHFAGWCTVFFLFVFVLLAQAAEWQWSESVGSITIGNSSEHPRAFLWIPPDCMQVRAIVFGQNNMIEEGILQHPYFRQTMARLGIAELFVAPTFDSWQVATNNDAANEKLDALLRAFADESGYGELKFAPIIPIGHSAMASYPWNFAVWNPQRTLAILSIHGDAPQTDRVGNGRPNVDWGGRGIDGIPGLMVMGEYEWAEDRIAPALKFHADHPQAPVAMLAEPGNGHYNYCDELVKYLAMFIRKAAEKRLPAEEPMDKPPVLKPVNPTNGWLVERWHLNAPRTAKPAPFAKYTGDPKAAFWCFDKEMALATQNYFADESGKLPQLLSITDSQMQVEKGCGEPVSPRFLPLADGVTFRLDTAFMDIVPGGGNNKNPVRWTRLQVGTPLGHATGGGPIMLHKIVGPAVQTGTNTFTVSFDRVSSAKDGRNYDIWIWASQPGDAKYKGIVQQASVKIPSFNEGGEQRITFSEIPDQKAGTKTIPLKATSDSGRPVYFYVREGPAEVDGDELRFAPIPPRAKFPVIVAVVAWQLGRSAEPKLKTAVPVTREFFLTK